MNAENKEIRFEPLLFKKRMLASIVTNQYCVWGESGESREIKADTAYEAFRSSGFANPVKIERVSSLDANVVEKTKFVPDRDESQTAGMQESPHDSILRRRNPIVSADELNDLIQSLRKEHESASTVSPDISAVAVPLVPEPEPVAIPESMPSAIGLDVHGDGFDEIIPVAPVAKPAGIKTHETRETAALSATHEALSQPSSVNLSEHRELSPDEVQKLLEGDNLKNP